MWPIVKKSFEERFPFKRACLNNKTHNALHVENLPAEFILTTDARLRSRFCQEQYLFWFREPYATLVLVTCENISEQVAAYMRDPSRMIKLMQQIRSTNKNDKTKSCFPPIGQ